MRLIFKCTKHKNVQYLILFTQVKYCSQNYNFSVLVQLNVMLILVVKFSRYILIKVLFYVICFAISYKRIRANKNYFGIM